MRWPLVLPEEENALPPNPPVINNEEINLAHDDPPPVEEEIANNNELINEEEVPNNEPLPDEEVINDPPVEEIADNEQVPVDEEIVNNNPLEVEEEADPTIDGIQGVNERPPPPYSPPPGYNEVVEEENLNDPQPEEEMEIAAAIRDLLRHQETRMNQIIADNRAALTQQMNAQQDVLDQLVARLVAPAPVIPPVNVAVPIRAILGPDLSYDGKKGEAVVTWIQRVNQKALAEGWTNADTLRAAIGALSGKALEWQAGIGHAFNDWTDWSTALLTQFDIKLNEFQWMLMVEGRKQLPNESGSDYALAKRTMIVRRATPVTNEVMVRALIRGLCNSDHRAAMLNNEPANLAEFIDEINRLEGITKPPLSVDEFAALMPLTGFPPGSSPVPPTVPPPQPDQEAHTIQSIGTALKQLNARLDAVETRQVRPFPPLAQSPPVYRPWQGVQPPQRIGGQPAGPPVNTTNAPLNTPQQAPAFPRTQAAAAIPPRPAYSFQPHPQVDNRICYRCNLSGHIGRDCPTYPGPAPQRSGNGSAGPMGQSGQQ